MRPRTEEFVVENRSRITFWVCSQVKISVAPFAVMSPRTEEYLGKSKWSFAKCNGCVVGSIKQVSSNATFHCWSTKTDIRLVHSSFHWWDLISLFGDFFLFDPHWFYCHSLLQCDGNGLVCQLEMVYTGVHWCPCKDRGVDLLMWMKKWCTKWIITVKMLKSFPTLTWTQVMAPVWWWVQCTFKVLVPVVQTET